MTTVWIENTNGSKINPETGQIIEEEKAKNTKDKIIDNVKDVLINAGDKTIKEYFPNYQRAVEFFKHDEYELIPTKKSTLNILPNPPTKIRQILTQKHFINQRTLSPRIAKNHIIQQREYHKHLNPELNPST